MNGTRGYIALMSALMISGIIVIIILTLGQISFLNRINISDTHFKNKSRALAEACVNTALLDLAATSSYAGNETITVASDTCKIFPITASGTLRIISAQGAFENSFTNYKVAIPSSSVSIVSWEEVQSF